MNGIIASQFDNFLKFSDLFLLQISFRGDLINIRPKGKSFFGWNFENRILFNFFEHFLKPNQMSMQIFLKFLEGQDHAIKKFTWKSPDNKTSQRIPTFFRTTEETGENKNILIFVKENQKPPVQPTSFEDKKYTFQAKNLPGFIHNLNGPLGTIMGRVELLQLKYPEIAELEEIVRVSYRIQSSIENITFKLINEKAKKPSRINFNRFLREEITFLNCDLFFKHQIEKVNEFSPNIPEFMCNYSALSGIFSEFYQFMRQFVDEQKEYVFITKSFTRDNKIGFSIDFLGDFITPGKFDANLPCSMKGHWNDVSNYSISGFDNQFISKCLASLSGFISLDGSKNQIKLNFQFPIPAQTIRPGISH